MSISLFASNIMTQAVSTIPFDDSLQCTIPYPIHPLSIQVCPDRASAVPERRLRSQPVPKDVSQPLWDDPPHRGIPTTAPYSSGTYLASSPRILGIWHLSIRAFGIWERSWHVNEHQSEALEHSGELVGSTNSAFEKLWGEGSRHLSSLPPLFCFALLCGLELASGICWVDKIEHTHTHTACP